LGQGTETYTAFGAAIVCVAVCPFSICTQRCNDTLGHVALSSREPEIPNKGRNHVLFDRVKDAIKSALGIHAKIQKETILVGNIWQRDVDGNIFDQVLYIYELSL